MRSQTLTKSHAARASFAPMRHFPESRGEEMPKALFSHLHGSPRASKRKNKTTAETPDGKTYKKSHAERHGISSIEKKAPKTKGSILSDSRCTRIHYSAPVPACKYAILASQKMTICHFGSYATNCPRARVPPRLSLAWIRGGRNAHGGHAGKCSRRGCCAAHRTSGLP